jgi:energy-coupling factor transport system ATP-binding protein
MEVAQPLEHRVPPLTQAEMAHHISETLRQVGLLGCERRDSLSLSGGQRQRLVAASILVRHPELLVLDQPMTDLDPVGRRDLLALLERLKDQGMTVVMAEHDPEDTLHADRILLLDQGQIAWEGTPAQFWGTEGLPEQYGLRPLPIAQCFQGRGLVRLPITVEEAWNMADKHFMAIGSHGSELTEAPHMGSVLPESSAQEQGVVLELERVSAGYSMGPLILEEVSFQVGPGEFIALLGKNGSGKSTLAQLLNGLLLPNKGRVLVMGEDTKKSTVSYFAANIGYVFQNPDHQIFAETVWEEVAFGAKNVGCSDQECAQRVDMALSAVGLSVKEHGQADPFSLTKGERQRVAVASVLAAQPKILIFDEPTTGLDGEEAIRMMTMIRELNQRGHTIVMITHAMGLVSEYATRCLVIKEGVLVGDGPTRTIFSDMALLESASLSVPPVTRFAQRWGKTLLTVEEVQSSLVAQ